MYSFEFVLVPEITLSVDRFNRKLFEAIIAKGQQEAMPLSVAVGLDGASLQLLFTHYFPEANPPFQAEDSTGEDAPEESDLRELLLNYRAEGMVEEEWLAAIIARRVQQPDHLWHSLGLRDRQQLSQLFARHFPELFQRNQRNMKWKKFLYRELCQSEGIFVCRSPVCESCSDYLNCFGPEA